MPSNLTSISFPSSPALNDTYTYGTQTYQWNGTEWVVSYDSNSIPIGAVTLSGNQTITGVKTFSNNMAVNANLTTTGNLTIDTNTLFVNSTTDRVGIGTISPVTKLELVVPSTGTTLTGLTAYGGIHLDQTNTNNEFVGITTSATTSGTHGGILFQGSEGYGTKIHFLTTDDYSSGQKNRMTLDHTGKLGIGTTSPTEILEVNGNIKSSGSIVKTIYNSNEVIEEITGICDGTSIVRANGVTFTFPDVTTAQSLNNTYTDVTGSVITYTPPTGTKRVVYEFGHQVAFNEGSSGHGIAHYKLMLDSTEVLNARRTIGGLYVEGRHFFKWVFSIKAVAVANDGVVTSWDSNKTIKIQARAYSDTVHENTLHRTTYWDGGTSNQFSRPTLTIKAIA